MPLRFARLLPAALAVLLLAPAALAQTPRGDRPAGGRGQIQATRLPGETGVFIGGTVIDASDKLPLAGFNVVATRLAADSTRTGTVTDSAGVFRLRLPAGRWRIRLSSIGYVPISRDLPMPVPETLPEGAGGLLVSLGTIEMQPDAVELEGITVSGRQARATVQGDTTSFNADAFRVERNATAEDLVTKIPGVTVENGQVTAQGQAVRRVTVDGREFFGDDASAALRNLPAEVIQDVQIFDRQSDQARFTGFDDGNRERTINLVTRRGRQRGQFGRVSGAAGADALDSPTARYNVSGTVNDFDGDRRLSGTFLVNNVNQQNFSFEDLIGAMGGGGGGQRGGGGGMTIMRVDGGGGGGMRGGGGFNLGDAFVGDRGGINAVASVGLNASNTLGKAEMSASYFGSRTANNTDGSSVRDYLTPVGALYAEDRAARSVGYSHRFNGRLEVPLGATTQLIFTPRVSLQTNDASSTTSALASLGAADARSSTRSVYDGDDLGYSSNSNLLVRHRFAKPGRSVSGGVRLSVDGRRGDAEQDVESAFFDPGTTGTVPDSAADYRRATDADSWSRSVSMNLNYTEPIGRNAQLLASYEPTFAQSAADQTATLFDAVTGDFTTPDPAFTSDLDRRVTTHRGGLSAQYRKGRFTATAGVDGQSETLDVTQSGGRAFSVDKTFTSVLPSASVRYQPSRTASFEASVRSSTNAPSATQLRNTFDDTNPLLVSTGNPGLRPSSSQVAMLNGRLIRAQGTRTLTGFASLTRTSNYVTTDTRLFTVDTLLAPGVALGAGSQLSRPVNLDGFWSARSFLAYGQPVGFLRSNANLSLGLNHSRTPGLVNGGLNRADATTLDTRLGVTSNISPRLDFNVSYGVSFTDIANSAAAARDQTYARHRGNARLTARPYAGLVLATDLNTSFYTGNRLGGATPTQAVWNASLGYSFLANDAAEVRLAVYDLLNRNTNLNRSTAASYVETTTSDALGRYVMLSLAYRIRRFNGQTVPAGPTPGGPGSPRVIMMGNTP